MIALELPADLRALRVIGPWIRSILEYADEADVDTGVQKLELALQEICVNVVEHAYGNNPSGRLRLEYTLGESHQVTVFDNGVPYDPTTKPKVDLETPTEGGYGLFLAETLCDDVRYERRDDQNCWALSLSRCAQLAG